MWFRPDGCPKFLTCRSGVFCELSEEFLLKSTISLTSSVYTKNIWKSKKKTTWSILVQLFHADSMIPSRSPSSHFWVLKITKMQSPFFVLPNVKIGSAYNENICSFFFTNERGSKVMHQTDTKEKPAQSTGILSDPVNQRINTRWTNLVTAERKRKQESGYSLPCPAGGRFLVGRSE